MDTEEMIYQSYLITCREFANKEISRREVTSLMGIPFIPQIQQYLGPLDDKKLKKVRAFYKNHQDSIYKNYLKLFPKVKETLIELHQKGKKLAVISSRTEPSLLLYLKELEILQYFDLVVSPQQTEKHKPHPEPVFYALKKLSAHAPKTLFVGDAQFDIQSGIQAGTDTALVAWGPNKPEEIEAVPHFILEDMDQLL